MKKLLLSGMFLMSIITSGISTSAQDIAFYRSRAITLNPNLGTGNKIVSEVEVNTNAVRDFKRNYSNATNVKWLLHDKGSSVYFTSDGIKMRSTYNGKGRKEFTLKYYYDESGLPEDLRHYVRSSYYDHKISLVTEVITNSVNYYLVRIENRSEILNLRIINDEITVYEQIRKLK